MAKNKGLTPKRKKIDRNPRVKHREKFRRAKIRRKGQVHTTSTNATPPNWFTRLNRLFAQLRMFISICFFDRCERFVGRIRDTAEKCLVFVLVLRRASN